jgi:virulence-associated protein VapD
LRTDAFREWLTARFAVNTVSTQLSTTKRVEAAYGDLDDIFENDRFESLLQDLIYSKGDEARRKANPSKMQIEKSVYDTLSSCRTAVRTYRNFLDDPVAMPGNEKRGSSLRSKGTYRTKSEKRFHNLKLTFRSSMVVVNEVSNLDLSTYLHRMVLALLLSSS